MNEWKNEWMNEWTNGILYSTCIQLEAVQSAEYLQEREKSQLLQEVTRRLSKQVTR